MSFVAVLVSSFLALIGFTAFGFFLGLHYALRSPCPPAHPPPSQKKEKKKNMKHELGLITLTTTCESHEPSSMFA